MSDWLPNFNNISTLQPINKRVELRKQLAKKDAGIYVSDVPENQNLDRLYNSEIFKKIVRSYPVKKVLEFGAKNVNNPQGLSDKDIIRKLIKGDKSFYSLDRNNGSNEINTYLFLEPYNTEFVGDTSIGPLYNSYIERNFPEYKGAIKTYNTHFGDTLYVDSSARKYISDLIKSGKNAGMRHGALIQYPSYIRTFENDRPYDAGGHLATFSVNNNDTVVNMSDIYQFEGTVDDYNAIGTGGFIHKIALNALDKAGKPFIVRLNNIPVVFKEIIPKDYKTPLQQKLGKFLSLWGDYYDLTLPKRLTDDLIKEIFDHASNGDQILLFMRYKGYLKYGGKLNYLNYFK